jgi:hypothetical protein
MKTIIKYDNENYFKEVTKIYDHIVKIATYRKVLGGTQWLYLRNNPARNYNNCWMPICEIKMTPPEYHNYRKKYCKRRIELSNWRDAVKEQSSIPKWAQYGSGN